MADKNVSDPTSHAVKNPLLSSAVTGVSIEDLTQHAVLLPVVRANVQDSKPYKPPHTAETVTKRPPNSGNAFSKPLFDSLPPKSKMEPHLRQSQSKNDQKKAQDDFDVDEYFARLQGMKYVSAPLNSNLDGDKLKSEAVLESESEDVDSNFSEINLRDDSQSNCDGPEDSGQSLTADLAQNLSQLPQVLPQVASAVFSSFSNILNRNILNSRVEPSEALTSVDYGGHSYGPAAPHMIGSGDFVPMSESSGSLVSVQVNPVPMFNAEDYGGSGVNASQNPIQKLDVPNPPQIGFANNFRLTSKKKHYAQVPGLRSGEIVDMSQTFPQNVQHAGMPPRPPSVPRSDPLISMVPSGSQSQSNLNHATGSLPSMVPNPLRPPSIPHADHLMGLTESQSQRTILNLPPAVPDPTRPPLVPHSKPLIPTIPSESLPQLFIVNQFNVPPTTSNQEIYTISNSSITHVPFIAKEPNAGSHIPSLPSRTAILQPIEDESSIMVSEPSKSNQNLMRNPFDYVQSSEPSLNVVNTHFHVPFTVPEPADLNAANNRKPSIEPTVSPTLEPPSSLYSFPPIEPNTMTSGSVPFMISEIPKDNSNNLERTKIVNVNVTGNFSVLPNSNTPLSSSISVVETCPVFQNIEANPSVVSTEFSNMMSGSFVRENSDSKSNEPIFFDPQSIISKETVKPPKNTEIPPAQNNIFRLQNKKRPQYYSGPIVDKSGLLLDNLIPEMVKRDTKPPSPFLPPPAMQDPSFFTPENAIFKPEFVESNFSNSNASVFDLNASRALPDYPGFDSNVNQAQNIDQDNTEIQNVASADVFGSFKSKFSAIKLDRIQSAVTTFFDPSFYNKDKKDDNNKKVDFQNDNSTSNYQYGTSSFDNSNENVYNTVPLQTVSDSYQNIDQTHSQNFNHPTMTTNAQHSISFLNPPQYPPQETQQTTEFPSDNAVSLQSVSFYNPSQYLDGQIKHSETQQTELSSDNAVSLQSVSFYDPMQNLNENNATHNLSSETQKTPLGGNKEITIKTNFVDQELKISHELDRKKSLDIEPKSTNNSCSTGFYNPLNYTNTNLDGQMKHVTQQPQLSNDNSDSKQNVSFYNPMDYLHTTQLRTDFLSNSQSILTAYNDEVANQTNFNDQQSNLSAGVYRKQSLDGKPQQSDNSNFSGFHNTLNYSHTKTDAQYPDNQMKSSETQLSDSSTNVLFYNPMQYSDAIYPKPDLSSNTKATEKQFVENRNKAADISYPTEFHNPLNYGVKNTAVSNVDSGLHSEQARSNIIENISLYNPFEYSEINREKTKLDNSDMSHITTLAKDFPTSNPLNIEKQTQETVNSFYGKQIMEQVSHSGQSQSGAVTSVSAPVPSYNSSQYLETAESQPIEVSMQSKQMVQSNITTNISQQFLDQEAVEEPNLTLHYNPLQNHEGTIDTSLNKQVFDLRENVLKNTEIAENVTFYNPAEPLIVDPTVEGKFGPQRSETDWPEEKTVLDDKLKNIEAYNPSEFNADETPNLETLTANITFYNPLEHCQNFNVETSNGNSNFEHSFTSQNIEFVESSVKSNIAESRDGIPSESTFEVKSKLKNMSLYGPQTLCQNLSEVLTGDDIENVSVTSESYTPLNIPLSTDYTIKQIKNTNECNLDYSLSFFESNATDSFNLNTQSSFNKDRTIEIDSKMFTNTDENALSSFAEVTCDSMDQLDRAAVDEMNKITKTQNLNVPNPDEKYSPVISNSSIGTEVAKQENLPVTPQQQSCTDFGTNVDSIMTKTLEIDDLNSHQSFINDFSSDINKTQIEYGGTIENEDKVETSERPLHLDLPRNASDEVKAGFQHAMTPEDIEELSTQLSLTNMKEDNLRDYDIQPTAPPSEEFDHLESELKNLNKISNEVAKNDVEKISSTTDDYKLANVSELDGNTATQIGDTEVFTPAAPISFTSYFDTGNFAAENHYKNSPLKQESDLLISEHIPSVSDSIISSSADLNTVLQADPLQFFSSASPAKHKTEPNENNWLTNYFGSSQTTNESDSMGVSHKKLEPLASESTSENTELFFHRGRDQNFFPDPAKSQPIERSSQPQVPDNQNVLSDFHLTQDHNYYTQGTYISNASGSRGNQSFLNLTEENKSLKVPKFAEHIHQFIEPQFSPQYQNYQANFSPTQGLSSMQKPTATSSFDLLRQNQYYDSKPVGSLNDPKSQQKCSFFHLTKDHNYFVDPETISNISETPSLHQEPKNHISAVFQTNLSSIDSDNSFFYQEQDQATDHTEKSVFHLSPDHNYFTIGNSVENQSYGSVEKLVLPMKAINANQETHISNTDETSSFFDVHHNHKMPASRNFESNHLPLSSASPNTNVNSSNLPKINICAELRGKEVYSSFDVELKSNNVDCQSNLYEPFSNSASNLDPPTGAIKTDEAAAKYSIKEELERHFDDFKVLNDCSKCRGLLELNFANDLEAGFLENSSKDIMEAEGGNASKTGVQGSMSDEAKNVSQGGAKQKGSNRTSVTFEDIGECQEEQTFVAEEEKPQYKPVVQHWFYRIDQDGKSIWRPFSLMDSEALEEAYNSPTLNENTLVATDGGRYDVNIMERKRSPIYWTDKPTNVRRCSWFYKGTTDARYVPYPEQIAERLEEEYRAGMTRREWHRRVELPGGESVVLHGPSVIVHFLQQSSPDAWGNTPQTVTRPRIVKRGLEEFDIDSGESSRIDHLLLLVHGIGSVCDLRFRSVEEVVDEFRAISLQLVQSHYKEACEKGQAGRVEVLPVSWHSTLHSPETGIDKLINLITLDSIPKLRNFTNDTLLDVLFYTSPIFCQTIMDTVGAELNRINSLFRKRNPSFQGGIALGGHSLGSLIIFDLLCHQRPDSVPTHIDSTKQLVSAASPDNNTPASSPMAQHASHKPNVSYMLGSAGTGQPFITYPALGFNPSAFFALGSPIGMFECVRGIDALGEDFALPTCPAFFNIFHPYDPVAYRIEPLINPELKELPPFLIPHHKGRKRMHLELKDTMLRVGTDLKQRLVESIRSTWASVWRAPQPPAPDQLQKVVQEQLDKEGEGVLREKPEEEEAEEAEKPNSEEVSFSPESTSRLLSKLGRLNGGRRVDHVLQEAPFEMINEYLFAMTSHVCYWESEDTMLLILREIYSSLGVSPDRGVPQQTLTLEVERPTGAGASRILTRVSSQSDSNIQFVREQAPHSDDLSMSSKRKPELSRSPRSSESEK